MMDFRGRNFQLYIPPAPQYHSTLKGDMPYMNPQINVKLFQEARCCLLEICAWGTLGRNIG